MLGVKEEVKTKIFFVIFVCSGPTLLLQNY